MPEADAERLRSIKTFPQLVKYLRDELDWPIKSENFDDHTFDYDAEELGLDPEAAAKIKGNSVRQLRPLTDGQPFGVFFVEFERKWLPVVALRRILRSLVKKKRQQASAAHRRTWELPVVPEAVRLRSHFATMNTEPRHTGLRSQSATSRPSATRQV